MLANAGGTEYQKTANLHFVAATVLRKTSVDDQISHVLLKPELQLKKTKTKSVVNCAAYSGVEGRGMFR